ncbi:CPBP family intramembrane metalloprotease [Halomicroarcula limicola]|uniref:CPBP family intramembrane metalloprotease n=1 Tax=Haloarcula limicola TaxID=1429915 RepID=A0A8J8C7Q6_9EURY|nr:CPBP family intramembrane glutamic endopeptidase [Halomicroarcula limicola]MBV0925258.1 CPBP family intramembrane metalloprotease [Halomicroarcula limicola]
MAFTPPYVSVADGRTIVTSTVRALAVVAAAFLFAGVFAQLGLSLFGIGSQGALTRSPIAYAVVNALSFVGFIAAGYGFVKLREEDSLVHVRRPTPSDFGWALLGVLGIFLSALLMGVVVDLLSAAVEAVFGTSVETGQNSVITEGRSNPELFLYMIPVALFFVGPAEELVFRGIVQGLFRRSFGLVPGLLLASLLFGIGHFFAISSGSAWTYILVAGALGLVLGAVYEYTESITVPALAHGLWNAGLFALNYYMATTGASLPV